MLRGFLLKNKSKPTTLAEQDKKIVRHVQVKRRARWKQHDPHYRGLIKQRRMGYDWDQEHKHRHRLSDILKKVSPRLRASIRPHVRLCQDIQSTCHNTDSVLSLLPLEEDDCLAFPYSESSKVRTNGKVDCLATEDLIMFLSLSLSEPEHSEFPILLTKFKFTNPNTQTALVPAKTHVAATTKAELLALMGPPNKQGVQIIDTLTKIRQEISRSRKLPNSVENEVTRAIKRGVQSAVDELSRQLISVSSAAVKIKTLVEPGKSEKLFQMFLDNLLNKIVNVYNDDDASHFLSMRMDDYKRYRNLHTNFSRTGA